MKCLHNDCLASEFDNLFYDPIKIKRQRAKKGLVVKYNCRLVLKYLFSCE
jgi:hypothetical protein